jgi:DNA-binding protein H-NS
MARIANLQSMSVDKLVDLRSRVDTTLIFKVAQRKRSIEIQLAELLRFNRSGQRAHIGGNAVAPKYRNPEDPSETWAGRGLKPRWLTATLKSGRKLEEFLIDRKKVGTKMTARRRRKW